MEPIIWNMLMGNHQELGTLRLKFMKKEYLDLVETMGQSVAMRWPHLATAQARLQEV